MTDRHQARRTFRSRLTASMTLLAVGILTAASTAIYLQVRQDLLAHVDSTLLAIARIEVASAIDEPSGHLHVHEEQPLLTASVGLGYEKFALIKDEQGQVRAQTSNLVGRPPLETESERELRALAGEASFAEMTREQEVYRGIYYPMRDADGRPMVAIVAISARAVLRSLDSLLGALALALIFGAAAAAFAASRMARRLTRPLEEIASAADAIGGTNLQMRIPDVSADAELRQMTRVLNEMLVRLEAAFTTQRSFVADASHELRSPVANLRGTVEVALRRPRSGEEYREALQVALTEAERLSRLVDDLLILSRGDAGQLALDVRACDLGLIAHDAVAAISARGQDKGVRIRLDAQPAAIRGDEHRLRQAVDNLLANALRYAPTGSQVVVATAPEDGRAWLSVQDSGPGLSAEELTHVFDRFYRADAARARDSGGLGLGLPIAKAIIEAHHGAISAQSQLGQGCRFKIVLPSNSKSGGPAHE